MWLNVAVSIVHLFYHRVFVLSIRLVLEVRQGTSREDCHM